MTGGANPATSPSSSVVIFMVVVIAILFSVAMLYIYRRYGKK
jgi:hypothetical protein